MASDDDVNHLYDQFDCPVSHGVTKPAGPSERARVIFQHVNQPNDGENYYQLTSNSVGNYDGPSTSNSLQCSAGGGANTNAKKKATSWLDALQIDPKLYWPRKYRYTVEPRPGTFYALNVKERDFYEENGFIIVKNLFSRSHLNKLLANLRNFPKSRDDNIIQKNDTLRDLVNTPQVLKYIEAFCGYNIMAMTSAIITDDIYSQNTANIQRDLHCLPFRPADRIVGLWICLGSNENTDEPGMTVIPGSHRSGYLETTYSDDEGNKVRMFYERINEIKTIDDGPRGKRHIDLKPGDALFYHPLLAYNIVMRPLGRLIAIAGHYASSECDYIEATPPINKSFQHEVPPYLLSSPMTGQDDSTIKKDLSKNQGFLVRGKRINL